MKLTAITLLWTTIFASFLWIKEGRLNLELLELNKELLIQIKLRDSINQQNIENNKLLTSRIKLLTK